MNVVTGATGYIGGALARALADRDGEGSVRGVFHQRRAFFENPASNGSRATSWTGIPSLLPSGAPASCFTWRRWFRSTPGWRIRSGPRPWSAPEMSSRPRSSAEYGA